MESLKQAQQQFTSMKVPSLGESVMNLTSVSRQPSTLGDGDFEVEEYDSTFPRTPRGSSRASHVSSLAHSHRYVRQRKERKKIYIENNLLFTRLYIMRFLLSPVVAWRWKALLRAAAASYRATTPAGMLAWRRTSNHEHRARSRRRKAASPAPGTITDLCT